MNCTFLYQCTQIRPNFIYKQYQSYNIFYLIHLFCCSSLKNGKVSNRVKRFFSLSIIYFILFRGLLSMFRYRNIW